MEIPIRLSRGNRPNDNIHQTTGFDTDFVLNGYGFGGQVSGPDCFIGRDSFGAGNNLIPNSSSTIAVQFKHRSRRLGRKA